MEDYGDDWNPSLEGPGPKGSPPFPGCQAPRQAHSPWGNPKLTQISLKRLKILLTCDHQPDDMMVYSRETASVLFPNPSQIILKLI